MSVGPVEPISPGQLFWLVAVSVVAGGVYIWPETVAADSGPNALYAILLTVALAAFLLIVDFATARAVRGQVCADRLLALWGPLGWFWLLGSLGICIAVDASILTLFGQFLEVFFYPTTDPWITRALLLAVATWLSMQSLPTLARNVQFWFPLVLLSFYLLTALAFPQATHLTALRPAWPPSAPGVAAGVLATWYLWIQGDVAVSLQGFVRTASPTTARRVALVAYLYQGAMLVLIWILVVGTLGSFAPQILQWPMPYIFATLGPESFFVARPGIFVLSTWAIAVLLYLATRIFCVSLNLQTALQLPKGMRSFACLGEALAIFALSSVLGPPGRTTWLVVHQLDPIALAFLAFRTLSSFLLSRRLSPDRPRALP